MRHRTRCYNHTMNPLRLFALLALIFSVTPARPATTSTATHVSAAQRRQVVALVNDIVAIGIASDFKNGRIADADLVEFGIFVTALHHRELFRQGATPNDAILAARHVAAAARRYFDRAVHHQTAGIWKYRGGFYHGYFELFEQLAPETIKRLHIAGDGRRALTVDVAYVNAMASADSDHDVIDEVRLTFRPVTSHHATRYVLTAYRSLSPRPQSEPRE